MPHVPRRRGDRSQGGWRLLAVALVGVPLLLSGSLTLRTGAVGTAPAAAAGESPAGSRPGAAPGRVLAQGAVADPATDKSFTPATIGVGGTTTLEFDVFNPNSVTTLTGVSFTDTLPDGLVVGSAGVTSATSDKVVGCELC